MAPITLSQKFKVIDIKLATKTKQKALKNIKINDIIEIELVAKNKHLRYQQKRRPVTPILNFYKKQ